MFAFPVKPLMFVVTRKTYGHSKQAALFSSHALAGRQGTKRGRRMEGSERVAADIDRVG